MVKKLRTLTESDDKLLVEAVRSSAHLIWQAGLGAFSQAQEEGDKAFTNLMNVGSHLQRRMRSANGSQASNLVDTVGNAADTIGKQAAGSWGKIEHAFEERLARALQNIGVPSRDDIEQLAARIEELRKLLEMLPNKGSTVSGKASVAATAKASVKKPVVEAVAKTTRKAIPRKPAVKAGAGTFEIQAPEPAVRSDSMQ